MSIERDTDVSEQIKNSQSSIQNGSAYWQSIRQHADSASLAEAMSQEFPGYDPDSLLSSSRRSFMKLAGASLALAGVTLTGCRRWPKEQVLPYNARPDGMVPGEPEMYASMTQRGGVARGTFVTTFDGRPIKVDGSPLDPTVGTPEKFRQLVEQYNKTGDVHDQLRMQACVGVGDKWAQASTLDLYDPARSRSVLKKQGDAFDRSTWDAFTQAGLFSSGKVAVLAPAMSGPTANDVKARFERKFGQGSWFTYEPLSRDNEVAGSELAFGRAVRAHYDTSKAEVIAAFDSDLLNDHPTATRNARGWAQQRRRLDDAGGRKMNRLYAAGPSFNPTLSSADASVRVKPSTIAILVEALAAKLGVPGVSFGGSLNGETAFIDALANDLKGAAGKSLVVVGPAQPAEVHALVWAINATLGNLGTTITLTQEPDAVKRGESLAALVEKLNAGGVETLLVLGGNPVFDAPAGSGFVDAYVKVPNKVHLGQAFNETSQASDWHLPEAHELECWGDGHAWDGTVLLQQPMIEPIWGGRSAIEVAAIAMGDETTAGYHLVRRAWTDAVRGGSYSAEQGAWNSGLVALDVEKQWRAFVHDGLITGSGFEKLSLTPGAGESVASLGAGKGDGFEVRFVAGRAYDGRFANNGWLQELPDPMTKVCWDNPAWISVTDAKKLGLENGDHVSISVEGKSIELPVVLMPGQAPGSLIIHVGGGREVCGHVGRGAGHNVYPIFTGALTVAASVSKGKGRTPIAYTAEHHLIDTGKLGEQQGRGWVEDFALDKRIGKQGQAGYLIKEASFDEFKKNPNFAAEGKHGDVRLQLFAPPSVTDDPFAEDVSERYVQPNPDGPAFFNVPHAWGMTIDMASCIGCGACIVACQAENNIPVVGKDQVLMSREMHWLRLDTYYKGDPEATTSDGLYPVNLPLACIHCENAPCEQVCPVAATVHDTEGLNTMVYNRCIGTRYCSNNCPYKVRRFNYFDYHSKLETAFFRNKPSDRIGGIQNKPWLNMPDTQQDATVDQVRRMVFNPDVTVRMRGVMEKCTYCTQRITRAKITTKAQWAKDKQAGKDVAEYPHVGEGEIATACQQACPTEAIVFGNLNDPASRVSQLQQKNPRSYKLLEELNNRPRTTYLAKVTNTPWAVGKTKAAAEKH